jgi:hypothetical protein
MHNVCILRKVDVHFTFDKYDFNWSHISFGKLVINTKPQNAVVVMEVLIVVRYIDTWRVTCISLSLHIALCYHVQRHYLTFLTTSLRLVALYFVARFPMLFFFPERFEMWFGCWMRERILKAWLACVISYDGSTLILVCAEGYILCYGVTKIVRCSYR